MLYSVTAAAVYESCELEKVRNIFYMLTHQIPPGCSLLGRTRPSRAARLAASGRMLAQRHRTHTCTHDTGDPRAYYMSKNARARARCTFTAVVHAPALVAAAPAASRPAMARSTAASRRLSHRPLAAPSPPRQTRRRERGPTAAAAAAAATAAAELLGSAPTMAAAADQAPVRIERRLLQPPRPAPAGDRMAERRPRAPSGAAREAGWRRAKVGGWWRSRADAVEDGPGHFSKP
jgi:hypothetical protein